MPFESTRVYPRCFGEDPCCSFFVVVLLCVSTFWVPCCDSRYDFQIKMMFVHLYLQLFVGGPISNLRYVCMLAHSGVQHILCCVFCFVFLRLVYSLDFTFVIATSIFSNVYLETSVIVYCIFVFPFKSTLYNIACTMKYAECGYHR